MRSCFANVAQLQQVRHEFRVVVLVTQFLMNVEGKPELVEVHKLEHPLSQLNDSSNLQLLVLIGFNYHANKLECTVGLLPSQLFELVNIFDFLIKSQFFKRARGQS